MSGAPTSDDRSNNARDTLEETIVRKLLRVGTAILYVVAAALIILGIRDRVAGTLSGEGLQLSAATSSAMRTGDIAFERFIEVSATGYRVGPEDAPLTILVYSNYGCGYCASYQATLEALRQRYPQHLALVFKHFTPGAGIDLRRVHQAAACADDQSRFYEFHQEYFRSSRSRLAREHWRAIAQDAGLRNADLLTASVRSAKFALIVSQHTREGQAMGVTETPTSFLNGTRLVGDVPFDVLDRIVARSLREGQTEAKGL